MNQIARQRGIAGNRTAGGYSPRPARLSLLREDSPGREELERCIARKFHDQHDAKVEAFLPLLLSLGSAEQLNAIVGLRPAAGAPLFLEQYLDSPVEQAISGAFMTPVDRGTVVEIGNLATAVRGETYALFAVLARVLHLCGFRWIVCTATRQVEAMLEKVRFPTRAICNADPARLGERALRWGNYYSSRPRIITGDARIANELLQSMPQLLELIRPLDGQIEAIAAELAGTPR